MKLFIDSVAKEIETLHKKGIRLKFIGDKTQLPFELRRGMESAEKLTAANKHLLLNVMLNYGGKWDICSGGMPSC